AIPGLKPLPEIPTRGPVTVGSSSPAPSLGNSGAVPVPPAPPSGLVPVPAVPVPPAPGPTATVNVVPANAWATAGQADKVYRVQPAGGEQLGAIAQRTLGNGGRWTDIYRLNPTLNPRAPVPAGALLTMPPDARLDP